LTFSEPAIRALLALTDVTKIVFGTDFPFAPTTAIPMGLGSLKALLDPGSLTAVLVGSVRGRVPGLS